MRTLLLSALLFVKIDAQPKGKNVGILPTMGEIWPRPQQEVKSLRFYIYEPGQFSFAVTGYTCKMLTTALDRYHAELRWLFKITRRSHNTSVLRPEQRYNMPSELELARLEPHYGGLLQILHISLFEECETFPYLGMDESYQLSIGTYSILTSQSIWGILRGLESFYQLFYYKYDYTEVRISATTISDFPSYPHRGLLLDTSRQHISVDHILTTLHAMSMHKLNVFHWHIVDDESFPYESKAFPKLCKYGAYTNIHKYTAEDITTVVEFARNLGIRVIPGFDIFGPVRSWGMAYPRLLMSCELCDHQAWKTCNDWFNPLIPTTYTLIEGVLLETQELFVDIFLHLGGNKYDEGCWSTNAEITRYMNVNGIADMTVNFLKEIYNTLRAKTTLIVWSDLVTKIGSVSRDAVVQVEYDDANSAQLNKCVNHGFSVIFSTNWTLDDERDWTHFYNADPRTFLWNQTNLFFIIGGEACMWTHNTYDAQIGLSLWPRTSAVAERLWSPLNKTRSVDMSPLVAERLEEQMCRLQRRGVFAGTHAANRIKYLECKPNPQQREEVLKIKTKKISIPPLFLNTAWV